ncbi:cation transporter [Paraburkholderia bonniea]|nr:cation transporter [Paraburkholderia bonniea]WJF91122.1 cation transporter [Paraburkholderia bonniea]WJF94437.1 cation transporter [Paraburkholderia bonniea]
MTIELTVKGMSCQHCVAAVTQAVHALDASATVNIDLAAGHVTIHSTQPSDTFCQAINEAGYTATVDTSA